MGDGGITVTRPWLTQTGQKAIRLLEPIYDAQLGSVVSSRVKAMDETPIKAGKSGHGKMKPGYFWPVYGEADEVRAGPEKLNTSISGISAHQARPESRQEGDFHG